MISKEAAVKELNKRGYNTELENGVVMTFFSAGIDSKEFHTSLKTVLNEIDYHASWGTRAKNNFKSINLQTDYKDDISSKENIFSDGFDSDDFLKEFDI